MGGAVAFDPEQRRSSRSSRAPASGRPCRRSGRCRSGHATARASAPRRAARGRAGRRRRARRSARLRRRRGGLDGCDRPAAFRPRAAGRRPRTRRRPGLLGGGREADRQQRLSRTIDGRHQPGSVDRRPFAGSERRAARTRRRRPERRPPPARGRASQPRSRKSWWLTISTRPAARSVVHRRRSGPARRAPGAPTSRASADGPARPGRRRRSCRRSAARRSRRRRPSAPAVGQLAGRGRGPRTPR